MNQPDYQGAIAHILARLEQELSPNLTYHSLYHTREDVLPAAERLSKILKVKEKDFKLLQVACAYHDSGFLIDSKDHEKLGVQIVQETLPRFGFTPQQIAAISGMIMATRLPQTPHNLLEQIIADADLDSLGRDDFFARGNLLRKEWESFGNKMSDKAWYHGQVRFLEAHRYFTSAAMELRDEGKIRHLNELEIRIKQAGGKILP